MILLEVILLLVRCEVVVVFCSRFLKKSNVNGKKEHAAKDNVFNTAGLL
jgi:hypothetical protein